MNRRNMLLIIALVCAIGIVLLLTGCDGQTAVHVPRPPEPESYGQRLPGIKIRRPDGTYEVIDGETLRKFRECGAF